MAFTGKWETETQEGYDEFCKLLGEKNTQSLPYILVSSSIPCVYVCVPPAHWPSWFLAGIPDDIIEKGRDYKLITEVTQDGDTFSWTQIYPTNAKVTNTFTIGKECDMETIGGKKFKVGIKNFTDVLKNVEDERPQQIKTLCFQATVHLEGGKLSVTFPNYHHTSEISGGKLVEVTGHNRDHWSFSSAGDIS